MHACEDVDDGVEERCVPELALGVFDGRQTTHACAVLLDEALLRLAVVCGHEHCHVAMMSASALRVDEVVKALVRAPHAARAAVICAADVASDEAPCATERREAVLNSRHDVRMRPKHCPHLWLVVQISPPNLVRRLRRLANEAPSLGEAFELAHRVNDEASCDR